MKNNKNIILIIIGIIIILILLYPYVKNSISNHYRKKDILKYASMFFIDEPRLQFMCGNVLTSAYRSVDEETRKSIDKYCQQAMGSHNLFGNGLDAYELSEAYGSNVDYGKKIDCNSFDSKEDALWFFSYLGGEIRNRDENDVKNKYCRYDPYNLDSDHDCIPCENLPDDIEYQKVRDQLLDGMQN